MNQSRVVSERPLRLAAGDAGRDADFGRAVAGRELGELNSSRLGTPAATTMNLVIGTSLVRPTTARS
jgi:hypothetical protein